MQIGNWVGTTRKCHCRHVFTPPRGTRQRVVSCLSAVNKLLHVVMSMSRTIPICCLPL